MDVEESLANCPLCGAHVNDEQSPSIYDYPELHITTPKQRLWQWSMFVSLFAIAVCVVVNIIVNRTVSWSIHALFGIILPWICVARPLRLKFNLRKHISWGFLGVIALLIYLNGWINKFSEPWFFWLGAPITVLVWQTVLELICIFDKKNRADYEMALSKLCVISLVCIGISFAWLKQCTWGWYVCAARGAVDVIALVIFERNYYFSELKRRLHI